MLALIPAAAGASAAAHNSVAAAKQAYRNRVKLDPYRDFAGDKDLEIEDEPDDKPPSDFAGDVKQASITNAETRQYGKGKFKNTFETQNGIQVSQVGKLRDDKVFVVMGSYSYTGADGRRYRVKYTADEFGYHPITELDLDLPELELELQPAARAPAPVRPSLFATTGKFGANGSGAKGSGANGSGANGSGAKGSGANGSGVNGSGPIGSGAKGSGAKGSGANGGGKGANGGNGANRDAHGSGDGSGRPQSDSQFTYGKGTPPPSSAVAHTYLPPNGYLPPATYLPPVGFKPTQRP